MKTDEVKKKDIKFGRKPKKVKNTLFDKYKLEQDYKKEILKNE